MFYCVLHSWFSSEYPCPTCHPIKTITTSDGIIEDQVKPEIEYWNVRDNSDAFHEWLSSKEVRYKCFGHFTGIEIAYDIFTLGMQWGVYKKENQDK